VVGTVAPSDCPERATPCSHEKKKKDFVVHDRAAQVHAVLILMERRPSRLSWLLNQSLGIEIGVAKVLVGIAVENVGAALR